MQTDPPADPFGDLLAANRAFADGFALAGFDGIAHAGVAMVTCMDSRIDPLGMIGLRPGDAMILRSPGGRVDDSTLSALALSVHLLGVDRILVVEHTRCAMASDSEPDLRRRLTQASGRDATPIPLAVIGDQPKAIAEDVARVRLHPLIDGLVAVGGFLYDVDTGILHPSP